MRWFHGSIERAVQLSKEKNSIFVVYVSGNDEMSKQMHEMINHPEATAKLRSDNFVAINLIAGTELYNQFVQIYQLVPVPSMFFIGKNGSPIEVIPQRLEHSEFMSKIDNIILKGGYEIKSESNQPSNQEASTSKSSEEEKPENVDQPKEITSKDDSEIKQDVKESPSNTLSVDEKVERAKILLEQQREAKLREEAQKERQREIERRKLGQDIQKMKRDQHEQEMKQLREERQKEKNEELAARQKILAQIAQDKEERAKKFGQKPPETSTGTSEPRSVSPRTPLDKSKTRLQFRLSDGSSHTQNFNSEQTLQEIRRYVQENMNLPYRNFDLSTTFPRRQFDEADNERTLLDLELVPNAVILIVPVTQHAVTQAPPGGGVTGFIWTLLTPFLGIFNYVKNFFTNQRPQPRPSPPKRANIDTSTVFPAGPSASKRRPTDTTVIRRQGNIHRLADRTERDSDDENNTWNGNSTQQM